MNSKSETTAFGTAALRTGVISVLFAALLGLGSLGYYGLGLSLEPSAFEKLKSGAWSNEVKKKIQTTYFYLFFSFYICMASGLIVYCTPILFRAFTSPVTVLFDFLVQTMVQNGTLFSRLNDEGTFSHQKISWLLYCSFLGAVASPAFILGIENAKMSIHVTCLLLVALIVLSLIAPTEKFVSWKRVLGVSEIAVLVASIGSALFPITTTPGAIFFSTSFYGGLILYPTNFLCHSQEAQIWASAEEPGNSYCAVAASVPPLLDAISILGRIVVMGPPD